MAIAYLTSVALFAVALLVRDGYELLKTAGHIDPTDTPVFATVFAAMCVLWASWFAVGLTAPWRLPVPFALQAAGVLAVVAGVVLIVAGMWTLRGVENIDHLVTTGPFVKLRHPMYAGFALLVLGWVAWAGAAANLLLAPLALASIAWWRHLEEGDLEARYGEAYAAYRATTWM